MFDIPLHPLKTSNKRSHIPLLWGCWYEKKRPRYRPVNRVPRLTGIHLIFVYMRSLVPVCRDKYFKRGSVLSLVQFDFSYNSVIITLSSVFILSITASKSNPIKVTCSL